MSTVTAPPPPDVGARAVAVASRRLLPLLVLMFVIAYVDRLNITFAETELERDLGLSASLYGLAAGAFFIGFVLLEVPSNLILHRVGARRWMARIMVTWGLAAAATAFVWDATSLIVARVLLGVAEAGFFPGVVFYLSLWFPVAHRGRAMAIFMSAIALSFLVAGPLSGALLELDGVLGLHGWQWLFIVEGLPAVLVGAYVFRALPDGPADAPWLAADERAWIEQEIATETAAADAEEKLELRDALTDRRVRALALVYLCINVASYGTIFWIADIVERIGDLGSFSVGLIAAIPFAFGTAGLLVFGRLSDGAGERRRYVVIGSLLGFVGLVGAALLPAIPAIAALSLGAFGLLGTIPTFWGMPSTLLTGRAAAGGIALINAIGVSGGFIGLVIVGAMKDATGSLTGGLLILAGVLLVGAALASRLTVSGARPGAPRPDGSKLDGGGGTKRHR
ncbi:MAG: MFS transporter [Solirubrobacteraceae bacterium]